MTKKYICNSCQEGPCEAIVPRKDILSSCGEWNLAENITRKLVSKPSQPAQDCQDCEKYIKSIESLLLEIANLEKYKIHHEELCKLCGITGNVGLGKYIASLIENQNTSGLKDRAELAEAKIKMLTSDAFWNMVRGYGPCDGGWEYLRKMVFAMDPRKIEK